MFRYYNRCLSVEFQQDYSFVGVVNQEHICSVPSWFIKLNKEVIRGTCSTAVGVGISAGKGTAFILVSEVIRIYIIDSSKPIFMGFCFTKII